MPQCLRAFPPEVSTTIAPHQPAQPHDDAARPHGADAAPDHLFGAALKPALEAACGEQLRDLTWFRTDWQRGGALTGYATWHPRNEDTRDKDRDDVHVVVKLPVPPQELLWLQRLQPDQHAAGQIVPRLFAAGRQLGGYDLAWVVMERIWHGPLDHHWGGVEIDLLADAAARFYAAAARWPLDQPRREEHWPEVLKRCRQAIKDYALPEPQRWNAAIKALQKKLPKLMQRWLEHETCWCHGDLHLANTMTHHAPPGGPAFLFDLAKVHRGHWIEDAVYFEHVFWSRPNRLAGRDVVKLIAQDRKRHGLTVDADWPRLADFRRALVAAAAPCEQGHNPNPHHLAAALHQLEKLTATLT